MRTRKAPSLWPKMSLWGADDHLLPAGYELGLIRYETDEGERKGKDSIVPSSEIKRVCLIVCSH